MTAATTINQLGFVPEVVQETVAGYLEGMEVLAGTGAVVTIPTLSNGRDKFGDSVTVPYEGTLGEWRELAKADDGNPAQVTWDALADTYATATVKHLYKAADLTRWASRAAAGNKEAELAKQIVKGAGLYIEKLAITAAKLATGLESYTVDASTQLLDLDVAIDAEAKLGDEAEDFACWLMNPAVRTKFRKLKDANGRSLLTDGMIGSRPTSFLDGIPIVVSSQLTDTAGVYPTLLLKRGAIASYFDPAVSILTDQDIGADSQKFAAHLYGCVHRYTRLAGMAKPGVVLVKTKIA
jgi:HK97 family phage major capsid protein